MPAEKTKSGLLAKLGNKLRKAHEKHRGDETKRSEFSSLPEGIEGGVARLIECKFDVVKEGKDNAGEYYFYAAGTVLQPKEFKGQKIFGLRTSITEPLYETPGRTRTSVDDHYAWILNALRLLGAETEGMELEDLEATAAELKEQAPTFTFRTWKGSKQTSGKYKDQEPRVQHQWDDLVEYDDNDEEYVDEDAEEGEEEAAAAKTNSKAEQANGKAERANGKAKAKAKGKREEPEEEELEEEEDGEAEGQFDEFGGIDDLVKKAEEEDDGDAQAELKELALKAGYDDKEVKKAKDWEAVGEMVKNPKATEEPEDEEESQEGEDEGQEAKKTTGKDKAVAANGAKTVKVGKVYKFQPPDLKKKGKFLDATDVEVVKIDAKAKTADVRDLDDLKKTFKGVAWSKLS